MHLQRKKIKPVVNLSLLLGNVLPIDHFSYNSSINLVIITRSQTEEEGG